MIKYLILICFMSLTSFCVQAKDPSHKVITNAGENLDAIPLLAAAISAVDLSGLPIAWETVNNMNALMVSGVVDSCDGIAIADVLDTLIACGGEEIGLMGSIGGGASFGTWVGGLGQFPDGINNLTGSYFPDTSEYGTSFPLLLITDDPPGVCVADTDTVIITILMPPLLDTILPVTACGSFDLSNLGVVDLNNTVGQILFYDSFPLTIPLAGAIIDTSGTYYVLKYTNTNPTCFDIVSFDITVTPAPLQEVWTGAVDNNWHNAGNWTCNVPTVTQDVLIPNGTIDCIIFSGQSAVCKSLIVNNPASLIIQPTGKLEIVQ